MPPLPIPAAAKPILIPTGALSGASDPVDPDSSEGCFLVLAVEATPAFVGVGVLALTPFAALFAGGDFTSAAFAREAAVPCSNLDPDVDKVERVGGDFVPLAGLGLPVDVLARADMAEPGPRLKDELSRRSCL